MDNTDVTSRICALETDRLSRLAVRAVRYRTCPAGCGESGAVTREKVVEMVVLEEKRSVDSQTGEALPPATLAEQAGSWVAGLRYEDIPSPVTERAKALALDCFGLALVAADTPVPVTGRRALEAMGGVAGGPSTVLATGERLTARDAAFLNGLAVGGLDWDDTHLEGAFHVSAGAFPAVLAVAEAQGCSGREFLLAYIVALEVACRAAAAPRDGIHQAGFAPTGVAPPFGCAAATALLLGGGDSEIAHAQGIAGSTAAGLLEFLADGAWTKNIHGAWSAHGGVSAGYLAMAGFSGPLSVYEGEFGLYETHLRDPAGELDPAYFGTLGTKWETLETAAKQYPVCHFSQAFLKGWFKLSERHGIGSGNIRSITCRAPDGVIPTICEPRGRRDAPLNPHDAQESLPYVLAAAILSGEITERQLTDEMVRDPEVLSLARSIRYERYPESLFPDSYDGEIVIETTDGRTYRSTDEAGRMEVEEIEAKFLANAERAVGRCRGAAIHEAVMSLEDAQSLDGLIGLVSVTG
ncbi:MAG: MmgE/PrpD family protein [bacterium]|nr:MmgE/PrpD family protein [bacterium]